MKANKLVIITTDGRINYGDPAKEIIVGAIAGSFDFPTSKTIKRLVDDGLSRLPRKGKLLTPAERVKLVRDALLKSGIVPLETETIFIPLM